MVEGDEDEEEVEDEEEIEVDEVLEEEVEEVLEEEVEEEEEALEEEVEEGRCEDRAGTAGINEAMAPQADGEDGEERCEASPESHLGATAQTRCGGDGGEERHSETAAMEEANGLAVQEVSSAATEVAGVVMAEAAGVASHGGMASALVGMAPEWPRVATGIGSVREMLMCLRLEQYVEWFDKEGYDDLDFLLYVSQDAGMLHRIAESVGMRPGHAHKFCQLLPRYMRATHVD